MLADEQREVQSMTTGNIAVAVGMKHVSIAEIELSYFSFFKYRSVYCTTMCTWFL